MRERIAVSAAATAVFVLTAGAVTPSAASAPPSARGPGDFTIEIASVNGTGCPPGTAAVAVSDDGDAFTLTYSDYTAQVNGSSKPTDARRNCQVGLKVHVRQGITYAIDKLDYRVYADVQAGAKATQKSYYYFQGLPQSGLTKFDVTGPYDGIYQYINGIVTQPVFKPCGEDRNLNLNTELRVDKGTSDPSKVSSVSLNAAEGAKMTYHFRWKRCP